MIRLLTIIFVALCSVSLVETAGAQDLLSKPTFSVFDTPFSRLPNLEVEIPEFAILKPKQSKRKLVTPIDPGIFLNFKPTMLTPMPIFKPKKEIDPGILLKRKVFEDLFRDQK